MLQFTLPSPTARINKPITHVPTLRRCQKIFSEIGARLVLRYYV